VRRSLRSLRAFRGHHVGALPLGARRPRDLAWSDTLRQAAGRGRRRPALADLMLKARLIRPGRLVLFVVDLSGSMGTALMVLARRVALGLLQDAYLSRDRVAMIAFRGGKAELLFGSTNQTALVSRRLSEVTLLTGGTTPLAAGLELALGTLRRTELTDPGRRQTLVLISDGRANVGVGGPIRAELGAAARALALKSGLQRVFLDTTEEGKDNRQAAWLAEQLGAQRLELRHIGSEPARSIVELVRRLPVR
jgi:magnesium chelatase subunit D